MMSRYNHIHRAIRQNKSDTSLTSYESFLMERNLYKKCKQQVIVFTSLLVTTSFFIGVLITLLIVKICQIM